MSSAILARSSWLLYIETQYGNRGYFCEKNKNRNGWIEMEEMTLPEIDVSLTCSNDSAENRLQIVTFRSLM